MLRGVTREANLHSPYLFSCFPRIPCGDGARKFHQERDPKHHLDRFSSASIAELAGSAAHWVRWRRGHYFKLRQEIPQLDQWKNFLTVRGMKQTFKGRKILEDGPPAPTQLLNPLSLCENPEEDSAALEPWRRAVQSPCHGPNPRLRTLWTLDCSFTPTHLG